MVSLDVVRTCNTELIQSHPIVAVIVGGTSGIGSYTVRALATTHAKSGKGLRVYIVGRNKAAATTIISECLEVCPKGDFRFIKVNDLALLKEVDSACVEITKLEENEAKTTGEKARVDFLVMTQALLRFEPRDETKEGLDKLMSLMYYSRMRFTMQLVPLLLASSLPTGGRVVSVYAPGRDKEIKTNDLSIRDPKDYGFMLMGSHVAYMTTFFFEGLATKYAGQISFSHYFPSLVVTAAFWDENLPGWFKWAWWMLGPIITLFTVPPAECGQRVLFHTSSRYPSRSSDAAKQVANPDGKAGLATASDGVVAGGAYRVNWNNDMVPLYKTYPQLRNDGLSQKVWDHTMKAFEDIEAGRVFTE